MSKIENATFSEIRTKWNVYKLVMFHVLMFLCLCNIVVYIIFLTVHFSPVRLFYICYGLAFVIPMSLCPYFVRKLYGKFWDGLLIYDHKEKRYKLEKVDFSMKPRYIPSYRREK